MVQIVHKHYVRRWKKDVEDGTLIGADIAGGTERYIKAIARAWVKYDKGNKMVAKGMKIVSSAGRIGTWATRTFEEWATEALGIDFRDIRWRTVWLEQKD